MPPTPQPGSTDRNRAMRAAQYLASQDTKYRLLPTSISDLSPQALQMLYRETTTARDMVLQALNIVIDYAESTARPSGHSTEPVINPTDSQAGTGWSPAPSDVGHTHLPPNHSQPYASVRGHGTRRDSTLMESGDATLTVPPAGQEYLARADQRHLKQLEALGNNGRAIDAEFIRVFNMASTSLQSRNTQAMQVALSQLSAILCMWTSSWRTVFYTQLGQKAEELSQRYLQLIQALESGRQSRLYHSMQRGDSPPRLAQQRPNGSARIPEGQSQILDWSKAPKDVRGNFRKWVKGKGGPYSGVAFEQAFRAALDKKGHILAGFLAAGAQGAVFKGKHGKLNKRAYKINLNPDDFAHDTFIREAQNTDLAKHACIVAMHDLIDVDILLPGTQTYLRIPVHILELVDGPGDARTLLRMPDRTLDETIDFTQKVAEAIAKAHERGIIHRDIKLENVLLTEDLEPRIADYGLAGVREEVADKCRKRDLAATITDIGEVDNHATITGNNRLVGTPFKMPPEALTGQRITGEDAGKWDVYSLGIELYSLLIAPYAEEGDFWEKNLKVSPLEASKGYKRGSGSAALLRAISKPGAAVSPDDPYLQRLVAEHPEAKALVKLLVDMTADNPADRLSAQEVADELRKIKEGQSEAVRNVRRKAGIAATVAGTLLLAGSAVWFGLINPSLKKDDFLKKDGDLISNAQGHIDSNRHRQAIGVIKGQMNAIRQTGDLSEDEKEELLAKWQEMLERAQGAHVTGLNAAVTAVNGLLQQGQWDRAIAKIDEELEKLREDTVLEETERDRRIRLLGQDRAFAEASRNLDTVHGTVNGLQARAEKVLRALPSDAKVMATFPGFEGSAAAAAVVTLNASETGGDARTCIAPLAASWRLLLPLEGRLGVAGDANPFGRHQAALQARFTPLLHVIRNAEAHLAMPVASYHFRAGNEVCEGLFRIVASHANHLSSNISIRGTATDLPNNANRERMRVLFTDLVNDGLSEEARRGDRRLAEWQRLLRQECTRMADIVSAERNARTQADTAVDQRLRSYFGNNANLNNPGEGADALATALRAETQRLLRLRGEIFESLNQILKAGSVRSQDSKNLYNALNNGFYRGHYDANWKGTALRVFGAGMSDTTQLSAVLDRLENYFTEQLAFSDAIGQPRLSPREVPNYDLSQQVSQIREMAAFIRLMGSDWTRDAISLRSAAHMRLDYRGPSVFHCMNLINATQNQGRTGVIRLVLNSHFGLLGDLESAYARNLVLMEASERQRILNRGVVPAAQSLSFIDTFIGSFGNYTGIARLCGNVTTAADRQMPGDANNGQSPVFSADFYSSSLTQGMFNDVLQIATQNEQKLKYMNLYLVILRYAGQDPARVNSFARMLSGLALDVSQLQAADSRTRSNHINRYATLLVAAGVNPSTHQHFPTAFEAVMLHPQNNANTTIAYLKYYHDVLVSLRQDLTERTGHFRRLASGLGFDDIADYPTQRGQRLAMLKNWFDLITAAGLNPAEHQHFRTAVSSLGFNAADMRSAGMTWRD